MPDPDRLVEILSYATSCPGESPLVAAHVALFTCLRLSLTDEQFWTKLSANSGFRQVLRRLLLTDPRQNARVHSAKSIQDFFSLTEHAGARYASAASINGLVTKYFWAVTSDLMAEATGFPQQCEDLFRLVQFLLIRINKQAPDLLDIANLAAQVSQLLLDHTTTEVCDFCWSKIAEQIKLKLRSIRR